MSKSISITNFDFKFAGYGHYKVTYTYPSGKQIWSNINDMTIIDATKNSDSPKTKDLNTLKSLIKSKQKFYK